MKCENLQLRRKRRTAGFTLLEMSTAMGLMVALGVALVVMVSQHVQFLKLFSKQAFLTSEAPRVGDLLGRILNETEHYFVYANKADALAHGQPVMTGGKAVRLFYRTPTQEIEERLVAVETAGSKTELKFYGWREDGTQTSWIISNKLSGAEFRSEQGILTMKLQGPNGEEITYGGGAR